MKLLTPQIKLLVTFLLFSIFLLSCGSQAENANNEKTQAIPEATETNETNETTETTETTPPTEADENTEDAENTENTDNDDLIEEEEPIEEELEVEMVEPPEKTIDAIKSVEPVEWEAPELTLDPVMSAEPEEVDEPVELIESNEPAEEIETEESGEVIEPSPSKALDKYQVVLSVDENLMLKEKGELTVWIGAEENKVEATPGMAQDETSIPASIGQYAKITPFAPNFEVSPVEYSCIRIHPSGSEVRFELSPISAGDFEVSANIELYDNPECTGTPVPKSAAKLSVMVGVDRKKNALEKLTEMGTILWDKFLVFWGALIALVFGFILYLIRKKMKNKTGYDAE